MLAMLDVCNFPEQFGLQFGRRFCISFFLSLLASMVSRASCKMDLSMCENLLKAHVDSLDQQQYMKVDLDEVVEDFEGFLMGGPDECQDDRESCQGDLWCAACAGLCSEVGSSLFASQEERSQHDDRSKTASCCEAHRRVQTETTIHVRNT